MGEPQVSVNPCLVVIHSEAGKATMVEIRPMLARIILPLEVVVQEEQVGTVHQGRLPVMEVRG